MWPFDSDYISSKRFAVTTTDALEHDRMMDTLATLPLECYDDFICTTASIYFARDEDRTLFLLKYDAYRHLS